MKTDELRALLALSPGRWEALRGNIFTKSRFSVWGPSLHERGIVHKDIAIQPKYPELIAALHNAAPALLACAEAAQFVIENLPGALSNHIGRESYQYADMAREKAERELAGLRTALKALDDA